MDDFTRQCLIQNRADFQAGRISNDKYMNSLLSIFTDKNGGYINDNEYVVYPDCRPKQKIVFDESSESSESSEKQ
jgi:hypothetical protein